MRILMLNHNVAFTGGATFFRALQLARQLVAQGDEVTLLASTQAGSARLVARTMDGVQVITAPGLLPRRWRYGYDYYEAWQRTRWVQRQLAFDIVYAFDSRPTVIYPALAAQAAGARLVMDWCDWFGRGGSVDQRASWLARLALRPLETYYEEHFRQRAAATTVISGILENRARALGLKSETILRLPSGADVERLRPEPAAAARAAASLPADGPIVGYLGALFKADAELLARAWDGVTRARPDARLILIGDSKAHVPIERGVIRTGFIRYEMLGHFLAACDVLCLPLVDSLANRGRWPSKLMDYFAVGRPTVGCDVGEVGEIIRDCQAGVVAGPEASSLATGVLALLADPAQAEQLGGHARQAAENRYSWTVLTAKLSRLFQSVR